MKYRKLIILATNELDRRINIQFGVEDLIQRGIEVEFWNFSPLTYRAVIDCPKLKNVEYITFFSKHEFRSHIQKNLKKPYLYLVYMNYTPKTYFVFRGLSSINADIAYCISGVLPTPSISTSKKILNTSIIKAIKFRLFKILIYTPLLRAARYQLNTCKKSVSDYKVDDHTSIVPFNTTDKIISLSCEDDIIGEPYYVFVDQYVPYHPDAVASGAKHVDDVRYFSGLNSLFKRIEKETGCVVVIAAHPVAEKYLDNNPFENRKLFYYKTQTLIKHCRGVINHYSTAISYTVLYNKPTIIITSDDMINITPKAHAYCECFASELGVDLVNIDHLNESPIKMLVNEYKYKEYKENYIVMPGAEGKTNSDIMMSLLNGEYEG